MVIILTANPSTNLPTWPDPIWTSKQADLPGTDPATENIPWQITPVPQPKVAIVSPVSPN